MNRAYSVFEVKSFDDDLRQLAGLATSPKTDRMGDIVEASGAEYSLPLPLLWQHNAREPIGHVTSAKLTDKGIEVTAEIMKISEPGKLKDRLDEAWQSLKHGLVRGFSIGFRPTEDPEPIKGTWGLHFKKWEWLELSAVTIPANVDASITTVKQYDEGAPAEPGTAATSKHPEASGRKIDLSPPKAKGSMTIAERIAAFEAKRAANAARLNEITEKAGKEGRSKDAAEREEFDNLQAEIGTIDSELKDLRALEQINKDAAKPVDGTTQTTATQSRDVVVRHPEKLEKGIEFARFVMCVAAAKGDPAKALNLAKSHYPQQQRAIGVLKSAVDAGRNVGEHIERLAEWRMKAAVPAGDTQDATWASPLVDYNTFAGDFIEFLRPRTILGQFGQNGVPDLRTIPFNVHIKGQTSGGTGYWVGEGAPKPVTAFDFNDTYHPWTKAAAISVLTEELIRFSNPSAERLVREALSGTIIERLDTDFVDPTLAAVSGVRPASITNGVSAVASSGTDADAVAVDLAALWAAALAANLPLTSAVYITTPALALNLSLMRNALGNREFPDMTMTGGRLGGIPVIVSNYVDAGLFILAFASEIYLSDDGQVTVDASREASIQMLDNPTNTPIGSTVATSMVSMFQTNSVALRAERFIHWSKRRSTAVAMLEDVAWGPTVASA